MTTISIELVPRSEESLRSELDIIKSHFTDIQTVNIPDLLRFDIRSWEGCRISREYVANAIPHIRSIDFDLKQPFVVADFLRKHGLFTVLLVSGDIPQDMSRRVYQTRCLDFIRFFKREYPEFKVYAAIDPYRQSFRAEIDYVKEKIDAGVDGFFTQPFFDLRMLEIYDELMGSLDVFWGVSPVLSDASKNYWESKNNAVFPADFRPDMKWNVHFAKEILEYVHERQSNIYFMPIRAKIEDYLGEVLF